MPPTTHATLGASKAEQWMACPGSIRLSKDLPDVTSPYAQEGTTAHAVAERALRKNLPASTWVDTEIEGVLVTEEMTDAVQVFVDYVRHNAKFAKTAPMIEVKFDLSPLNPPAPMFGTSDAVIWDEERKTLHVIDYKHGQGVAVDAEENAQLMYYALGATIQLNRKAERFKVTIVQPRAAHPAGIVRSFEFGFEELVGFKNALFEQAVLTTRPDAPLQVGEHCRFCKALAVCPEQKRQAALVAQTEFMPEKAPPAPETLTQDELNIVLTYADTLEDWLDAVRRHVIGELQAGRAVGGWKLVPKRATRKWADEPAATSFLEDHLGGDAYTQKLLSPAQAEKLLKKIKHQLPDELVIKESSGVNLAPPTDPRPALLPSAQTEFDIPVDSTTQRNSATAKGR